jgi:hypothetical protein
MGRKSLKPAERDDLHRQLARLILPVLRCAEHDRAELEEEARALGVGYLDYLAWLCAGALCDDPDDPEAN